MIAHAREVAPAECCGLDRRISGTQRARFTASATSLPSPRWATKPRPEDLFAAQRQMRERGEELLAIYHSHPRAAEPSPSETDVRLAYYPSATYLIVGLGGTRPAVKAFSISEREQRWQQVEYEIAGE